MCYPPPPLTSDVPMPPFPSTRTTAFFVSLYILSGVTQPLLMEVAAMKGLANKRCQLYMLFYYAGAMGVSVFARGDERLSWSTTAKTSFIAAIDIVAQTMNYSGATLAGPTIFAVVYSSVTVWCALFARLVLGRRMSTQQWAAVLVVFVGLGVTGLATVDLGSDVVEGTLLVGVGSAMHGMMYVLSESLMNTESVSSAKFCGVYGTVACTAYLLWQVFYTSRHFGQLILEPMEISGTTVAMALAILLSISAISMLHSATFFHTVKYCPGGSTSAGVMKVCLDEDNSESLVAPLLRNTSCIGTSGCACLWGHINGILPPCRRKRNVLHRGKAG